MPAQKSTFTCPVCARPTEFNAPPTGFFCSDRCKLIDLGKWLGEDYRISEALRPDHFEEFQESSSNELDPTDSESS